MRKLTLVTALLLVGAGFLFANGTHESTAGSQANGTVSGTIGILMPSIVVARWAQDADSMIADAKKVGLQTEVQYADDKIENQVAQIENMITKGYKALIVCPVDATALGNVLQETKAAGIPVISYDRLIKNTKNVDYYLTFDNVHVGEVCGQYIVDKLGLANGKGPYNLEIFTGDIADNNATMTYQGGMNVLQKYIDNKQLIVRSGQTALQQVATPHWGGAEAQARMDNIMSAYYTNAHLDVIFSTYGGMSLGCIASLKALGYGTPKIPMPLITAQDAEKAITIAVARGDLSMSIFKDTRLLAQNAIDIAVSCIKGQKVQLDESKFYDNGAFKVPTFLAAVNPFDKDTLDKTVIDTGYWTHADIYGN